MPTNAIKPPISLVGQLLTFSDLEYWTEDDGLGDPWFGAPYRWTVQVDLYGPQLHGNHTTREPMAYTAQDVQIGDWIAEISSGRAVKIVNIDSGLTTGTTLVCDVEDVDRFNIYTDPSQSGTAIPYGDVLVFSVGKDGLPVFGPISAYGQFISSNTGFVGDVLSNFRYRNLLRDSYKVVQPGHTFVVGEPIYLKSDGSYDRAVGNQEAAAKVLGTVASVGTPGQDHFTFKPLAPITDKIDPPLPGNPGDLVYLDPTVPGQFTAVKPTNFANAVYIKISDTTGMAVDRGLTEPVNNYEATVPPTVTDDSTAGFQIGSTWIDRTSKKNYVCVDEAPGSAQWVDTTGGAGGGSGAFRFTFPIADLVWEVNHGKGSEYFTYSIYDELNAPVLPNHIEPVDANLFRVHFTAPQEGSIVVSFV